MSSIYRKGRDGYFYYQTYILNPETGKKNKRIFHSLSTRDREEAIKKQKVLDKKYSKEEQNKSNSWALSFLPQIKYHYILVILVCFFFMSRIIYKDIPTSSIDQGNKNLLNTNFNTNSDSSLGSEAHDFNRQSKISNSTLTQKEQSINLQKSDINDTLNQKKLNNIVNLVDNNVLPKLETVDYKIQRIETLSGAFKQGKIFVTLEEDNIERSALLALCKNIANDYSEFSNFVICIYDNSEIGRSIAAGENKLLGSDEKRNCWLALYTYNPVEGEYFDDNPGSYLGAF